MAVTGIHPALITLAMTAGLAAPALAQGSADDYAGDVSTSGTVSVGGQATGALETGGDVDWFAVTLTPGPTYTIDLEGASTGSGTLEDPLLVLYDADGIQVARDDDGGENLNARLVFSSRDGGTYYLADLAGSQG